MESLTCIGTAPNGSWGRESMNVRVRFEWLIAFSLLAGGAAWAQDQLTPDVLGQVGSVPVQYPPPEAYYASPGAEEYFAPPDTPDLYAELLPRDRGGRYANDTRGALNFRQMLRGSWLRMEYLQGNIQRTDSRTLGTPIDVADPAPVGGPAQDVANVANQFLLIFADAADPVDGLDSAYAQVPTTGHLSWHHAQGIRASVGVPIVDAAWVEASFWGYMNQTEALRTPTVPAPSQYAPGTTPLDDDNNNPFPLGAHGNNLTTFLATTLTTDGLPGSRIMLYDAGFTSRYESRLKAGNVDLVLNWKTPELGWRAQPIIGYRHEQYNEGLTFGGTFDNRSGFLDGLGVLATPETNSIGSKVLNQRDQIEFGMRNELATRFFTIGVQEKFALGSNQVNGDVITSNLREPGTIPGSLDDPELTTSSDRRVVVAPTFDLDVYAKVRMNQWLNFRVSYSLIVMGNLGVADQSIRFNEVTNGSGGTDPAVISRLGFGHRVVSALTVGGEIVLP